ncbi:MAG: hypothetical protein C0405_08795, partial [Desulfovibrio sp.]|nr:hypothetical protein [Desulfovibrio sp.]
MLNALRWSGIIGLIVLLPVLSVLLLAPDSLSAQPRKAPVKAASEDKLQAQPPKAAPTDAAFEQWLKKHGAYDRIVLPAPENTGDDGDANALKRAEGLLLQGSPQQALALIEAQPASADAATELQRLWLGAQAHRALGDPY